MQGLAQAQRHYDRQEPAETTPSHNDAMEELRADLKVPQTAEDISGTIHDRLIDADDDIKMLRLLAAGNDAEAVAIIRKVMQAVAEERAACMSH